MPGFLIMSFQNYNICPISIVVFSFIKCFPEEKEKTTTLGIKIRGINLNTEN